MSYRTTLVEERSPDGGVHWLALHPDLPGCHAIGRTKEEAREELETAKESWLRVAAEHGAQIPPEDDHRIVSVVYLFRPDHAVGVAGKEPVREIRMPQHA